jgi:hypothetical protein
MVSMMRDLIGDPNQLDTDPAASATCLATAPADRTVACTVHVAKQQTSTAFAGLVAAGNNAYAAYGTLGVTGLLASLDGGTGLGADLTNLRSALEAAYVQSGALGGVNNLVNQALAATANAKANVAAARSQLGDVEAQVGAVRTAFDPLQAALVATGPGSLAAALNGILSRTTQVTSVGAWFMAGYKAALDDLVATMAPPCDTAWDVGLTLPEPTELEIDTALALLDVPSCGLRDVAAATRDLVEGYADLADVARTDHVDAVAAQNALNNAVALATSLNSTITALESMTAPTGPLATTLDQLYVPGVPPAGDTGNLAVIEARLNTIQAWAASSGSLGQVNTLIANLNADMALIWPDDSVQASVDLTQCPAVLAQPPPPASGQLAVHLANQLFCRNADLGSQLGGLNVTIAAAETTTSAILDNAKAGIQLGFDRVETQVGTLAQQLADSLTTEQATAVGGMSAVIDQAKDQLAAELAKALQDLDLSTNTVIETMTEAMLAAQTDSLAASQTLAHDFAVLLANLGTADPSSRTGLVGKLSGITGQVGDTGTVLDNVTGTVVSFGAIRAGELRDFNLRSAQIELAQQLESEYHAFGTADEETMTVFLFHVDGKVS